MTGRDCATIPPLRGPTRHNAARKGRSGRSGRDDSFVGGGGAGSPSDFGAQGKPFVPQGKQ